MLSDSLFAPPLANDVEPNGTTATAVSLPQNGSNTGHVGNYYNNQRDTADWYKVTTTADGLYVLISLLKEGAFTALTHLMLMYGFMTMKGHIVYH